MAEESLSNVGVSHRHKRIDKLPALFWLTSYTTLLWHHNQVQKIIFVALFTAQLLIQTVKLRVSKSLKIIIEDWIRCQN